MLTPLPPAEPDPVAGRVAALVLAEDAGGPRWGFDFMAEAFGVSD